MQTSAIVDADYKWYFYWTFLYFKCLRQTDFHLYPLWMKLAFFSILFIGNLICFTVFRIFFATFSPVEMHIVNTVVIHCALCKDHQQQRQQCHVQCPCLHCLRSNRIVTDSVIIMDTRTAVVWCSLNQFGIFLIFVIRIPEQGFSFGFSYTGRYYIRWVI